MLKNAFFVIVLAMSAAPAFAAKTVTEFTCRTTSEFQGSADRRFKFRLSGVEAGTLGYEYLNEDEYQVVQVSRGKGSSIETLNDNTTIRRVQGNIELSGDGDGCEMVYLRLYRNGGYRSGYLRAEDGGCGADADAYATIRCSSKEVE